MADNPDLYSLVMDDEPTAQEHAAALAAAIRQQKQKADLQQQYGLLGQFTGDRVLSGVGKSLMGAADQGYGQAQAASQQMAQVGEKRLQRKTEAQHYADQLGMEREQLANTERHQTVQEGLTRRAQDMGNYSYFNGKDGQVLKFNHKTGQTEVMGQATPEQMAAGRGGGTQAEREWMKLSERLDPTKGENLANQKRINAAVRLEQLFKDPEAGAKAVRNLDGREMEELAMGMQNLISPGGHSAGEVAGLIPHTIMGNGQKTLEWLLNEPRGANQQAFVQKMAHTTEREKAAAMESLHSSQYGVLPAFSNLSKADRTRFEGILRGRGLDPAALDDSLVYKGGQGGSAAPAAHALNSGEVMMLDPSGKPHAVPESQVQAALAHNWKKG
jgi:hypothetical protein